MLYLIMPGKESASHGIRRISKSEESVVERQLHHALGSSIGVPEISKCRHGYPQAVLLGSAGQSKLQSGLVRLTCPWLVSAVDKWEDTGAIKQLNRQLLGVTTGQVEDSKKGLPTLQGAKQWRAKLQLSHNDHALVRSATWAGTAALDFWKKKFGRHQVSAIQNSGVAGVSQGKHDDIKCAHAHIAHWLLRGDKCSPIGAEIFRLLHKKYSTDLSGSSSCHEQCGACGPWRYYAAKNRAKLRMATHNRRKYRESIRVRNHTKQ